MKKLLFLLVVLFFAVDGTRQLTAQNASSSLLTATSLVGVEKDGMLMDTAASSSLAFADQFGRQVTYFKYKLPIPQKGSVAKSLFAKRMKMAVAMQSSSQLVAPKDSDKTDYNRHTLAFKVGFVALGSDLKNKSNIPPLGYSFELEYEFQFTGTFSFVTTSNFSHYFLDNGKYGEYFRGFVWGQFAGFRIQFQKIFGMEANQVFYPYLVFQPGIIFNKVDTLVRSVDLVAPTSEDYKVSAQIFALRFALGARFRVSNHVSIFTEVALMTALPFNGYSTTRKGYAFDLLDGVASATQRKDGVTAFDADNKRADVPFGFSFGVSVAIGDTTVEDRRDHFDRYTTSQPEKSSSAQSSAKERKEQKSFQQAIDANEKIESAEAKAKAKEAKEAAKAEAKVKAAEAKAKRKAEAEAKKNAGKTDTKIYNFNYKGSNSI